MLFLIGFGLRKGRTMKKKIWSGIICLIALVLGVLPAYAAWVPAGLEGKNISALVEDPSTATAWYAGTTDGNLYKMTGSVWESSNYGLPSGVAVQSLTIDPTLAEHALRRS